MTEMFALLVVKVLRFNITFFGCLSEFTNLYLRTITSTKSYHMYIYISNYKYFSLQKISLQRIHFKFVSRTLNLKQCVTGIRIFVV